MQPTKKLIFVYNANSGFLASLIDGLHKSLKPSTYQCDLCALTYGSIRMKKEWKYFISSLPVPVEFFHRDDFAEAYPNANPNLPAVFIDENGQLREVISSTQFAAYDDIKQLMSAVTAAVRY